MHKKTQTILAPGPPKPIGEFVILGDKLGINLKHHKEQFNFKLNFKNFDYSVESSGASCSCTLYLNELEVQEPNFELSWFQEYELTFRGYGLNSRMYIQSINVHQETDFVQAISDPNPHPIVGNRWLELSWAVT